MTRRCSGETVAAIHEPSPPAEPAPLRCTDSRHTSPRHRWMLDRPRTTPRMSPPHRRTLDRARSTPHEPKPPAPTHACHRAHQPTPVPNDPPPKSSASFVMGGHGPSSPSECTLEGGRFVGRGREWVLARRRPRRPTGGVVDGHGAADGPSFIRARGWDDLCVRAGRGGGELWDSGRDPALVAGRAARPSIVPTGRGRAVRTLMASPSRTNTGFGQAQASTGVP